MLNIERLKEQLKEFLKNNQVRDLAITNKGEVKNCHNIHKCSNCIIFDEEKLGCDCTKLIDYLASEYKEPTKIKDILNNYEIIEESENK